MENLENDPNVIGYTPYSKYQIGNLVHVPITGKGGSDSVIGEIIAVDCEGDSGLFEIKNVEDNRTAIGRVGIGSGFSSLLIDPGLLGFERLYRSTKRYYKDDIAIADITDMRPYVHQDLRKYLMSQDLSDLSWPDTEYQTDRFTDIGYEVYMGKDKIFEAKRVLWDGHDASINTGLQYLHELQNFYAAILPSETLDLTAYIAESLSGQVARRERINQRKPKRGSR